VGAAGIETGAGGKVGAAGYEGLPLPPPPQAVRATIANNGIRREVDMGLNGVGRKWAKSPFSATSPPGTAAQSFSVSPVFGCHFISRRSPQPTAASSSSAKAVSTRMPAITVLMSNEPSACRIR
jgi:hypothetical protein